MITADSRLQHQVRAQRVVVGHIFVAARQTEDALRQHVADAVANAGLASVVAEGGRCHPGQPEPPVDLPQQHHAAIAGDVSAIERRLNLATSNLAETDDRLGTLWHWQSPVVFDLENQLQPASAGGCQPLLAKYPGLGVDRDSGDLAHLFDERSPAVMRIIADAIERAHAAGIKVGICGQAPSNYPEFARFLVEHDIDSISLNPDSFIVATHEVARTEAGTAPAAGRGA